MPPPRFLRQPVWHLRADGTLVDTGQSRFALSGLPLVVVARARCQFQKITLPEGLTGGRARQAAILAAQAAQPFADTGLFVARFGNQFRAWTWDSAFVGAALEAAGLSPSAIVLPETVVQPEGDGWRIVVCDEGYDAQYWVGGVPMALQWRPTAFDRAGWFAFARSCAGDQPFPDEPPPALRPVPRYQGGLIAKRIGQALTFDPLAGAATAAAALLVMLLAFDAVRLVRADEELSTVTAALDARRSTSEAIRTAGAAIADARRDISTYNKVAALPQPIDLVARVAEQRALATGKLRRWALADGRLQAVVDLPPDFSVSALVQALEALPELANVTADVDRVQRRVTLNADVVPISTGGRA